MDIEIKIDPSYNIPKVIILTDKVTEEINALVTKLSEEAPQIIAGFRDNVLQILQQDEIIRVYSSGGKVFALTEDGEFILRLRLYEMEERLDSSRFVRISNSEIVNLKKVKSFDLSFVGTICVLFDDSTKTYVSRRYVSKIKKFLGV
ncbi:MAG: LytTR family DNA-binding domain-containing protein [Huintestinicola sp.]